ncbi:HNH endonuclease [Sphingomonas lutea]|uniref:HNH endonuclease n=1 Tax=Sphingomonas lutea TaxID=1045317 RepID=A0A7G9SFI3_9SPHN|nr:HNH endonuclease [Sphingomonas lutea]
MLFGLRFFTFIRSTLRGDVVAFGAIAGIPVGTHFERRADVAAAGVHRALIGGIVGRPDAGAESIVASGGYEDDEDLGDVIIYTGQGGRNPETGRQVAHQSFTRGNAALVTSCLRGIPVRVVRGSTNAGYTYAGLFRVDEYWMEQGRAGFQICRFRMVAEEEAGEDRVTPPQPAKRIATTVLRIVRDTKVSQQVKALNDFTCQVCGTRLMCVGGPYAEGAHIRPLGKPHNGPDVLENLLCLCANHHVLFDHGGFVIDEGYLVLGLGEPTPLLGMTKPGQQFLAYHRSLWQQTSILTSENSLMLVKEWEE